MADEEKKEEATEEVKAEEAKADAAEETEEVEVPEKFKDLVEKIETLSVLDLSELVKVLEKKFGVSAAAPMAVAVPGAGGGEAAGGDEAAAKSSYNIELTSVGDQKIEVIKIVRDATGKGLKEAKDLVDAAASGAQVVKEGVPTEEAEELKKRFEAAGAGVELK